jgi:hypothetical protein
MAAAAAAVSFSSYAELAPYSLLHISCRVSAAAALIVL